VLERMSELMQEGSAQFHRFYFISLVDLGWQRSRWQANLPRHMIELMTIGYEGMTPAGFLDLLKRCKVAKLVDVRELPISRKPGFAKAALSAAVQSRDIGYEHVAELGCPRDIRHAYRDDGNWARYTKAYKAYLETQLPALQQLAAWMQDDRCCLMCFEEDYNFCHRSFVAERMMAVLDEPMRIQHLTGPMIGRVVRPALVAA
jgi:uncharacterized protein (DUF488 family)